MAGRFLFQKVSSSASRSRSLLGAHASASAWAGASATRTASTASYSHAAPKTCFPTIGMPSITINSLKPAFVDSGRGMKRTFSSSTSIKNRISGEVVAEWEAERAARKVEAEAKSAAWQAEGAAWRAQFREDVDSFTRFMSGIGLIWAFNILCWTLSDPKEEDSASNHNGLSG